MLSRLLRLCLHHVLFGFDTAEFTVIPLVFSYLLNLAKHSIWLAHNDFRFRNQLPSAVDVIAAVRSQVCFVLQLWFPSVRVSFLLSSGVLLVSLLQSLVMSFSLISSLLLVLCKFQSPLSMYVVLYCFLFSFHCAASC